jgi:RNA polymerase sigma factor (sigma-70 family)
MLNKLEGIFRDNYTWLLQHVRRYTHNAHGAEDVASEAFLQLALYKDLDEVREPRALLTTIAKRVLLNSWRRRDLEQAYLDALASQPEPTFPSPEDQLVIVQALLAVDEALADLPAKARQAFLYSQLDGMTYAEIGKELGVSASMVRQYMARAMLAVVMATSGKPPTDTKQ